MEGAGLLHCSLNNSIKNQKLQSKWGGIKAPRLCHRAPAASASSTSAPRLSSHCLCSHVLLLPSTSPAFILKAISYPMTLPHPLSHLFCGISQLHKALFRDKSPLGVYCCSQLQFSTWYRWEGVTRCGSHCPLCFEADQMQGSGPLHYTHLALVVCSFHRSSPKTSGLSEDLSKG